jgi:hypothetical protein
LAIFNKTVREERFDEVKRNLNRFDWYPTFNNLKALYLKSGSRWEYTPIPHAKEISKQEAWGNMPREMLDYIIFLPEFNVEIFKTIIGGGKGEGERSGFDNNFQN